MGFLDRDNLRELREYIADHLNQKIEFIIEQKMEQWYKAKMEQQVDRAIKEAFSKMVIVKFGE